MNMPLHFVVNMIKGACIFHFDEYIYGLKVRAIP